jgi:penicillin-binding protein 1A
MKRYIKWIWRTFIGSILLISLLLLLINLGVFGYMPKLADLENPKSNLASEVYSSEGALIGKYYLEYREPCDYKDISPNVVNALISTEDERFRNHSGIDLEAIGRAVSGVLTFRNKGGASTISQQTAKALLGQGSKNTFTRIIEKLKEQIIAVKLERNLTKDEILTLYLNTVSFSDNAYGIRAASKTYFNKLPDSLKIEEAAVLVGMLKATSKYNPRTHPAESKERRNVVMKKMVDNGKLSNDVYNRLKDLPVTIDFTKVDGNEEMPAPYFRQVVEQDVKEWCKKKGYNLYKDGLKIYTTLDTTLQKYAEQAVESHAPFLSRGRGTWRWSKANHAQTLENIMKQTPRYAYLKEEGKKHEAIMEELKKPVKMKMFTWNNQKREKDTTLSPIDSVKIMRAYVQTGFMAMEPESGEVKAWVGGINHKYFKYDHCNEKTKRQVGSTMKPLLYCYAVDNGYSPCMPISCRPVFFPGVGWYNPGGSSYGTLQMKDALAYSVNNGTMAILKMVGIPGFVKFCSTCGISTPLKEYASIALGAQDISLIEMLRSYTMFPNYGINTKPIYITRIEDRNGNLLEQFVPERAEIINEQTAYKMIRMMQGTTSFGTAKNLKPKFGVSGEVAGKTGTTNDEADAWFIGYTPQLLAGAWVGCEERFMGLGLGQGATAAMPIWGKFFKLVQEGGSATEKYNTIKEFEEPLSMEGQNICSVVDKTSEIRKKNIRGIRRAAKEKSEDSNTPATETPEINENSGGGYEPSANEPSAPPPSQGGGGMIGPEQPKFRHKK